MIGVNMSDFLLFGDIPISNKPVTPRKEKCAECAYIQRWAAGGSFFHYCGARKSNKTDNGLLKVKCKSPACDNFHVGIKETKNESAIN
jgi:hypothetical protein